MRTNRLWGRSRPHTREQGPRLPCTPERFGRLALLRSCLISVALPTLAIQIWKSRLPPPPTVRRIHLPPRSRRHRHCSPPSHHTIGPGGVGDLGRSHTGGRGKTPI